MTVRPLDELVDLVGEHGMDPTRAATIAAYIADRCAGLSLATVHSSAHSSLHNDAFLLDRCALSRSQVAAWLALVRGTRPVRRGHRLVGGQPGFVEAVARGSLDVQQLSRFRALARRAAGQPNSACREPAKHAVAERTPPGCAVAPSACPSRRTSR